MRKLKKHVWPYQITVPSSPENAKGDAWCKSNIGQRFKDWYSFDTDYGRKRIFAFKDEETLLVFKLKWG